MFIFKVTEPSSIPYGTHPACAKRAAYPDPPPVIPLPDTGVAGVTSLPSPRSLSHILGTWYLAYLRWTKTEPTEFSTWVSFRPEMFSGIGALPKPATESHVVSKGNPVAPCRLKAQGKRTIRVGSPCSPDFPLILHGARQGGMR